MSGGFFEYSDSRLKNEIFGFDDRLQNVFEDKEISELVWDILELIHRFDCYKSGDVRKEAYLRHKNEFKEKWLRNNETGERIREIVDVSIEELRNELYETFDIDSVCPKHTNDLISRNELIRQLELKKAIPTGTLLAIWFINGLDEAIKTISEFPNGGSGKC